jgi:hypothetical protein
MENVKIAEITLERLGCRYSLEQHYVWHVNKKRNGAELTPS